MHLLTALCMAIAASATPIPTQAPRGTLLDLSPILSPDLKLGGDHQCTGIGISVCDPINVEGEQNNGNTGESSETASQAVGKQDESKDKADDKANGKGDGPLINLAPDVSPDISLGGDDGCLGLGISACNPINVKGSQNNNKG